MNTLLRTIPKLAFLFSGNNLFRFIILTVQLWIVLLASEFFNLKIPMSLKINFKESFFKFTVVDKSDIAVLKETFLEEEYKWNEIKDPKIIIDLGAHAGDTALYFHANYPSATIYAVEPDPVLFMRLSKNIQSIPNIIPVQAAVSSQVGSAELNISTKSSLSGSLKKRSKDGKTVSVSTITLRHLYQTFELQIADLCKFDIEGAEGGIFINVDPSGYAKHYIGEVHKDLMDVSVEDFSAQFKDFEVIIEPTARKSRFTFKATKR